MHVPHLLTRLDTQHCALNIIYNSFGFYLFVPYLTSPRTTLTWAFDHQSHRDFLSHCQEIHPKVRRETKLQNKIPIYYSIALKCWNASKLFSRKYGCYRNKNFSLFHWNFNVSTTCVLFLGGGAAWRPFPVPSLTEWCSFGGMVWTIFFPYTSVEVVYDL